MGFSRVGVGMRDWAVLTVPAFEDNYLWLIHDGKSAVAVDPGDAEAICAALTAHQLTLVAILLTHHHADHVGGVQALQSKHSGQHPIPVYGPRKEAIAGITAPVSEGQTLHITELALDVQVLDVPGHTLGHIAYFCPQQGWLFCGDTLFGGGCGRLFEGSAQQMLDSLSKLATLPDATEVYCAHEYTLSNLRFALEVEPDNLALQARQRSDMLKRQHGIPTIPSSIALEKATNPFLRAHQPSILTHLQNIGKITTTPVDTLAVFTILREWKNVYR